MRKPTTSDASKKSTTGAFRFGVGAVALLAPLALGGCMSGGFEWSDEGATATVSQALCTESDLTTSTTLATNQSSSVNANTTAAFAIDNNIGTRWESASADPQWMQVDLGADKYISRVKLDWETASASNYTVQVATSAAPNTWTIVSTKTGMASTNHRIDDITGLAATGRYVRINGTARSTGYGYSIWEMDVYGDANTGCAGAAARNISNNLEAESNDGITAAPGIQFETCSEGGQDAAFIDNTDYIEWSINVPTAGNYTVNTRSASTTAASYEILVNGASKTTMNIPSTGGWQTWQTFTTPSFALSAGTQTMRIKFTSAGQNLNYLKVNAAASCTPSCSGKVCGSDGCGGSCGTCAAGTTCNAGQTACVSSCTPTTCAAQGKNCGSISDGCSGTLNCGSCGSGQTCTANVCQASGGTCTSNDLTTATNLATSTSSGTSASAFDNNAGSRWESTHGVDPQWIQVDLGASKFVNRVNIVWEAANAKDYSVRISNDVNFGTYTTLVTKTNMANAARTDDLTGLSGSGRYVRVHGTARNLTYGYSIWEMNVFGDNNASCGGGGGCTPTTSCSAQGKTCGTINDGCATVSCGTCGAGQTCNASQQCVAGCTPNCSGKVCGNDGCGGSCGSCPSGHSCDAPQTSCLPCNGGCPSGQTCNANNACVAEQCAGVGGCGMGQKCVNNACQNDTTAGAGYYNSGVTQPEATPGGAAFWGSNLKVYSSAGTSAADIQAAFTAQRTNQFGSRRDAFMFAPGTYPAQMDIGFYTQIAGLGDHPATVNMTGWLNAPPPQDLVDASGGQMNGTQTFWRVIENFKYGSGTTALWAVSQAAPARRIYSPTAVFKLHYDHWVSGGFLADSDIANLEFGGQQQWYTRNSKVGAVSGGAWNIVYQGLDPASGSRAGQALFSDGGIRTEITSSPVIREKPFLYVNRDGLYKVRVPGIRTGATGTSWSGTQLGTSIPISSFYVVKPGDTAATMNDRLRVGKHLLFTPGIYHLSQTLNVTRANTVVLGIGLATLIPDGGVKAMTVADVDGVTISGLLFDAGTTNSPVLLEVGPSGSSANHSANPTALHDLFFRIGGTTAVGKATVSLQINSNNVIGDHAWVWRADHSLNAGDTGWTVNTAQNGVVVNGNNVTYYGLFVEHFQQYQVLWNGNNGKTFFYQSELPYDPPNQAAYMNGSSYGWASYKVADGVTTHEGWGMGIYAVFTVAANMQSERAIEANNSQPGVTFDSMCTTSLGPAALAGKINHIVNDQGAAATTTTPVKLSYWH